MTLDEDIAWWTKAAFATQSEAALIAFGVATGLKIAKADYKARGDVHAPAESAPEGGAATIGRGLGAG